MIDWNETRMTDNFFCLYLGDYSKLCHSPYKCEITFDDTDGLLLDSDDCEGLKSRVFSLIKTQVNDKLARSQHRVNLIQKAAYLVTTVLEDVYEFLVECVVVAFNEKTMITECVVVPDGYRYGDAEGA